MQSGKRFVFLVYRKNTGRAHQRSREPYGVHMIYVGLRLLEIYVIFIALL